MLHLILALFLSLGPTLSAHQCPCDKDILSLQEQADKIVLQNIKDVYRQEFGTDPESSDLDERTSGTRPHLYVFVSLSMPMPGLLDLGKQAKAYGGVLVLRGLVDGSYRKTALKLKSFIEQTKTGMIIDPLLFRTYQVSVVPSVVLTSGSSLTDPSAVPRTFDKVCGFISVKGALEQMEKAGDLKSMATQLLKASSSQEVSK